MKIIITENQFRNLRIKRRKIDLDEIRKIIEYQKKIQDMCNFDDGDDYANFCITVGIGFYFKDEGYEDENDEKDENMGEVSYEVRDEVFNMMNEEYYEELVLFFDDNYDENDCEQ